MHTNLSELLREPFTYRIQILLSDLAFQHLFKPHCYYLKWYHQQLKCYRELS